MILVVIYDAGNLIYNKETYVSIKSITKN